MSTGIAISEIRIRNFRCLQSVDLRVTHWVALIGENNSGKTSLLQALNWAIGSYSPQLTENDIFLSPGETRPPRDRDILVDLLIRPVDRDGTISSEFPAGSPWLELWGNGVTQDSDGSDIVSLRTRFAWDTTRAEYHTTRRFIVGWPDPARLPEARQVSNVGAVRRDQIQPLELHYIDAQRDIASELTRRGSFWQRLAADPGLPEETTRLVEESLTELNRKIISESQVLTHAQTHLAGLQQAVSAGRDSVSITPLARHLRDFARGMDIHMSTAGAPSFPLSRQGMGTRSLASLLTFRAFVTWKEHQAAAPFHPFVAIEEPEAHLQPQAQRALFDQLRQLPGQCIVSTHSPYVCTRGSVRELCHFSKTGPSASVNRLAESLETSDADDIDRLLLRSRGEIFFARALVLFEGVTEELALPGFACSRWGVHPYSHGISFVSVGGFNYRPFVRLASALSIPWFVIADAEKEATKALDAALFKVGEPPIATNPKIVLLPDGSNLENYISTTMDADALCDIVKAVRAKSPEHALAIARDAEDAPDRREWVRSQLDSLKPEYAQVLAKRLEDGSDSRLVAPPLVGELLEKLEETILPKAEEK